MMDRKIHIGFICHEYPPCNHGGIGSFTKDLAQALYKQGYAVTIIGYYMDSVLKLDKIIDEVINGIRILRYPHIKKFSSIPLNTLYLRYDLYTKIKALHKEKKFDVIESPGGSGWFPFGLPLNIPLVTRLHGGEVYTAFQLKKKISRLIRLLEKRQLQNSKQIISVSKYTAETIRNLLQVDVKYKVIYNSVDSNLFEIHKQYSTEEKGLIVFSGTIKKAKGVEELIKSMNIVCKMNQDAHLILAGKITLVNNGESYEDYLRTLLDKEYQNKVSFTGMLDRKTQLTPLLKKSEVCCFPSYFESFGLGPLEAMILGKSVIFTQTSAGPEIIEDNVSGLLCDPKNPEDIANNILLLLEDDTLRKKLAKNGKKRVLENFTFEKWIKNNIDIYHKNMELNNDK